VHGCKRDAVHGFHYSGRACVEACVFGQIKVAGCRVLIRPGLVVGVEGRVKDGGSAGRA